MQDGAAAPGGKALMLAHQMFATSRASQPAAPASTAQQQSTTAHAAAGVRAGEPQAQHIAAQGMSSSTGGVLVLNEPDAGRRARLSEKVLAEYLPATLLSRAGAQPGRAGVASAGAVRVTPYEVEKHWARHEPER